VDSFNNFEGSNVGFWGVGGGGGGGHNDFRCLTSFLIVYIKTLMALSINDVGPLIYIYIYIYICYRFPYEVQQSPSSMIAIGTYSHPFREQLPEVLQLVLGMHLL